MTPFRYKLTAVQRVRDRREHDATERYAHALNARVAAQKLLDQADHDLAAAQLESARLLAAGTAAGDFRRQLGDCSWLQDHRDLMARQLDEAEGRVSQALGFMITARREAEAVRKHHDKARDAHRREQDREDQKVLDDLPLRTSGLMG